MATSPEYNPTASTSTTLGGADPTVERLKQGAHDTIDRIADKAGPAVERLRGTLDSASTTMRSQVDDLHAKQEAWMVSARETVRENPLTSVAIALAAGMLIGRIGGR